MSTSTLTRQQQITKIQTRTKLLLETLLGIDQALDKSPRHAKFRTNLLSARLSIGETNRQLHDMDDEELTEWGQSVESMIEKIRSWIEQASNRERASLQQTAP